MNYKILDNCFKNTTRNIFIIFLIIKLEYISIFIEIISITTRLLNENQDSGIIYELNQINPYFLIQKLQTCTSAGKYSLCTFSDSAKIILIVFIIIFFLLYYINATYEDEQKVTLASESDKKTFLTRLFSRTAKIFANFIFLIFHFFGMILLFVFTNFLLFFIYSLSMGVLSGIALNIVFFLFSVVFYFLFIKFYYSYVTSLNVIVQFHEELSYHSDNLFSRSYDYFLIYLKIIITITDNIIIFEWENSYQEGTTNYKILFLSVLIICSIFVFTLSISFKVLRKGILYLINPKYNVFRIFMIHFTMFFLIFLICFRYQLNEPIVFVIIVLTVFACAIFVTFLIAEKNRKNTLSNENIIYQVAYVISKKHTQSSEELNNAIYHMFMIHKMNCDKNANYLYDYENLTSIKENICQICQESEFTFENFLKDYYTQIKFLIRNKIEIFSVEEIEIFTMVKLLNISILQKHKIVKLYFKIVEILSNPLYKNKSMSLCLNINRLKNYVNNNNLESIRIFKILKTYHDTSVLLKRIIDISDDIYTSYEFEKDIYKRAEQINIARDEILTKIVSLLKYSVGNKDSEDLYSLILFKKIYEEIFNTNIDNFFYNFNQIEIEQKISENFRTDKFLTILYDVSKDNFLITKATNEMKVFYNKKLDDMFPDDFKSIARQKFLKLIRENEVDNFRFEFWIKDPLNEVFLKNVSLKGRVCPSINFNELIVNTTYEISKENFILFEDNFMTNNKKILKSFTNNVGAMLCMTTNLLRHYHSYKLSFEDLFVVQNNETTQMNDKFLKENQVKQIECELNLYHYINLCLSINNIHYSNDGEQIIDLVELTKLRNCKIIPRYMLKLTEHIKKGYMTFWIYSISVQNKIKQKLKEEFSGEDEDDLLSEKEGKILTHLTTPSTLSYMSNAEKELAYFQNSKQSQKSRASTLNLSRLTTVASVFILFLISYSIIFMVIGIIDNQKIKETYSILMSFTQLKKIVYNTYTSVFNKFLLVDPNGVYDVQSYNNFFNNLDKGSTVNMNFDTIAMIELTSKIDLIQKKMLEFQYIYLSSYFKDQVNLIVSAEIEYNQLSVVNNHYSVIQKGNNIFDNLKTFMNLAQIIFEVKDIVQLDFINYNDGNIDFTNIQNKNYNSRQNFGIEIIINYLNIFQQTESISDQLQVIQNEKLQSIYILTVTFFITFILFHMSLIMICVYIIRSLRNLIANYLKLIDDLFSFKNIVYMKKKLSILKNLNELYLEDPTKLLKKLKSNKTNFNRSNRQDRKDKDKNKGLDLIDIESNENYSKWENSKKFQNSRNELIIPIIKMILLLFSIFYIYSFIFYFFMQSGHQKFAQSSLIFLLNSSNEDKLFNNYNLFEFMIFTNTSDAYLFDKLSNQYGLERSYIKNEIKNVEDQTIQVIDIINKNQGFDVILQGEQQLMNCTYLYTTLNDDILDLLYQENINQSLLSTFFTQVCEGQKFMQEGNINMVLEDINYHMQQILFQYKSNLNNPTEIIKIYYEPTLYNIYYCLIYIFRLIEQDINYNIISTFVSSQESSYLLILLMFLSLNIVVDIVILMFIKYMMIIKVINISTYIENFIDAIKIV